MSSCQLHYCSVVILCSHVSSIFCLIVQLCSHVSFMLCSVVILCSHVSFIFGSVVILCSHVSFIFCLIVQLCCHVSFIFCLIVQLCSHVSFIFCSVVRRIHVQFKQEHESLHPLWQGVCPRGVGVRDLPCCVPTLPTPCGQQGTRAGMGGSGRTLTEASAHQRSWGGCYWTC